MDLIAEAVAAGARFHKACTTIGLTARCVQRWREGREDDMRAGPKTAPGNKLTSEERRKVISILKSAEHCDRTPAQIVPLLADDGVYLASESTMYRILREENMLQHRGAARPPQKRVRPEHVATGPNQVWVWDITYLRTSVRGAYYRLYTILDVWSRKVVGWAVHEVESELLARDLFIESCRRMGIDPKGLVFHSDNGAAMKGSTLLATLYALGVVSSFSRPSVSDDNAFAEAFFRHLKYRPNFPLKPFASIDSAREWVHRFTTWYNGSHLHSGIKYVTPNERHSGVDVARLEKRHVVYQAARSRHPDRWTGKTRNWEHITSVRLTPERMAAA